MKKVLALILIPFSLVADQSSVHTLLLHASQVVTQELEPGLQKDEIYVRINLHEMPDVRTLSNAQMSQDEYVARAALTETVEARLKLMKRNNGSSIAVVNGIGFVVGVPPVSRLVYNRVSLPYRRAGRVASLFDEIKELNARYRSLATSPEEKLAIWERLGELRSGAWQEVQKNWVASEKWGRGKLELDPSGFYVERVVHSDVKIPVAVSEPIAFALAHDTVIGQLAEDYFREIHDETHSSLLNFKLSPNLKLAFKGTLEIGQEEIRKAFESRLKQGGNFAKEVQEIESIFRNLLAYVDHGKLHIPLGMSSGLTDLQIETLAKRAQIEAANPDFAFHYLRDWSNPSVFIDNLKRNPRLNGALDEILAKGNISENPELMKIAEGYERGPRVVGSGIASVVLVGLVLAAIDMTFFNSPNLLNAAPMSVNPFTTDGRDVSRIFVSNLELKIRAWVADKRITQPEACKDQMNPCDFPLPVYPGLADAAEKLRSEDGVTDSIHVER